MKIVNISVAKASLSRLVERVHQGDEVIIGKAGRPVAKLVPYVADATPRDLDQGVWKRKVWVADDFDELPEELTRGKESIEVRFEPEPGNTAGPVFGVRLYTKALATTTASLL